MPFKRGGTWYADFVDEHGKRRKQSLRKLGVKTEAQAKVVESKLIARAAEIKVGLATRDRNPNAYTNATARDWYLALPTIKRSENYKTLKWQLEKHITGRFADMRIELVKPGDVAAWLDEREEADKLKPRSVNNLRAYLSGMYTTLIERDMLIGDNPVRRTKRRETEDPKPRLLPFTAPPVIIDNASSKAWKLIFLLASYQLMRRAEIRRLRKSDIDLERGTIIVRKSKNKKSRIIPIHPVVRVYLEELPEKTDLVVPKAAWGDTAEVTRAALARGKFVVGEGVDACFHSLRHTGASCAVECGADPWAIEWIGWGPPRSSTMATSYVRPIAALARELAKLVYPTAKDAEVLPMPERVEVVAKQAEVEG